MKKERLFYLDFIRAISTLIIVITHYNAVFFWGRTPGTELWSKLVTPKDVFNLYIGNLGVSLFFIISGAAMMYVYGQKDKIDLMIFFKKRFMSLYPMFWIAYIACFLYLFYVNKGFSTSVPYWRFIFTVIGFDGYLSTFTSTFYLLGEWFLGCIVLIYLVMPFLIKAVKKKPLLTFVISLVVYILLVLFYNLPLPISVVIFTRLPEVIFGMLFVAYIKKVKVAYLLPSLAVLALNTVLAPHINDSFQTTYVGIATFLVLVFISQFFEFAVAENICSEIGKYSYAIFLVHHQVISQITSKFNLDTLTRGNSYVLFLLCLSVTFILSKILFDTEKYLVSHVFRK